MQYYAVQVRTRAEERFIKLFAADRPEYADRLIFPQRRMQLRRRGLVQDALEPVFPGYVFLRCDGPVDPPLFRALRGVDGFLRFLKSNEEVRALEGLDLRVALHFIGTGPVAGISKVYFNDDDRIVVREGPLMGLEGNVVKVDKRKGRAKIKLDLYDDSFTIDLAFEVIGRP